jgi:hypothetical protein
MSKLSISSQYGYNVLIVQDYNFKFKYLKYREY